jgi:hypothetical protein
MSLTEAVACILRYLHARRAAALRTANEYVEQLSRGTMGVVRALRFGATVEAPRRSPEHVRLVSRSLFHNPGRIRMRRGAFPAMSVCVAPTAEVQPFPLIHRVQT